jgi:hypothetical protein
MLSRCSLFKVHPAAFFEQLYYSNTMTSVLSTILFFGFFGAIVPAFRPFVLSQISYEGFTKAPAATALFVQAAYTIYHRGRLSSTLSAYLFPL